MGNARMLASINNGPGVPATLEVETEQIEIRSLTATKPDPGWEYVDQSGHFHAYDKNGKLPTVYERIERMPCPGGCDDPECEGYTITHYDCAICREEVKPGRVPDELAIVPGRTSWTVEVEAQVADEQVSVRITTGAPLDPFEAFGMAARGAVRAEGGRGGVRVWTTLHGVTPLGYRSASRAKVGTP